MIVFSMHSNEKLIHGRENPVHRWINSIHNQKHSLGKEVGGQSADTRDHELGEMTGPIPKGNSLVLNSLCSDRSPVRNPETIAKPDKLPDKSEVPEQEIRRHLGLRPPDTFTSDASPSFDSLNGILDDRKGDPEMILQNLGFSRDARGIRCRIPDRFLQTSSKASGISIEKFLDANPKLRDYLEEKSVIQNPFEMLVTSPQARLAKRRMGFFGYNSLYQVAVTVTMVNRFKKLKERKGGVAGVHPLVPLAEPLLRVTDDGCRYWSILADENRSHLETSGYYDVHWSNSGAANEVVRDGSRLLPDNPTAEGLSEREGAMNPPSISHLGTEDENNYDINEGSGNVNYAIRSPPSEIPAWFRATSLALPTDLIVVDEAANHVHTSTASLLISDPTGPEETVDDEIAESKPNSSPDGSNFNEIFLPVASGNNSGDKTGSVADYPHIACDTRMDVTLSETAEFPTSQIQSSVYEQWMQDSSAYPIEAAATETSPLRRFDPVRLKDLPIWFSSTDSDCEVRDSISAGPSSTCRRACLKLCRASREPVSAKAKLPSGIHTGPTSSLDLAENGPGNAISINSGNNLQNQFRGKLQKEVRTLSDSSGFADADQFDVAESSLSDVFVTSSKSVPISTHGLKERIQCISCNHPRHSSANRSLNLTNSSVEEQLQSDIGCLRFQFLPRFESQTFSDSDVRGWNGRGIVGSCVHFEHFPDLSDHRVLCDQLHTGSSPQFQVLQFWLTLSRLGSSTQTIATISEWIEFFQEEVNLLRCAIQEYKLMGKRLRLRISKAVSWSGLCGVGQDASLSDDWQELVTSENLQDAIVKEMEEMEELMALRMKSIVNLHEDCFQDCLPIRDLASKAVIQTMSKLLHEQAYQSCVVNDLYLATAGSCSLDHWRDGRSSLPVTPSSPLLHSPISMFASSEQLIQLSESVTSLTRMLHGMQSNAEHVTNESKRNKRKKNYQRLLPACLKPQWMKK